MSKCDMIRDILPLVAEDMASEETEAFVHEHLAFCPDCHAELLRMQREIRPGTEPSVPLKAVRRELIRRKTVTIILTALLVLAIILPFISLMTRPFYLSYEEGMFEISVTNGEDGKQHIEIGYTHLPHIGYYISENSDGSGVALYINAYSTMIDAYANSADFGLLIFDRDAVSPVTQIFHQQTDGREVVLLWGEESAERAILLPRLYLGYYLALAGLAAVALGALLLAAHILQSRGGQRMQRLCAKAKPALLRLLLMPTCYLAAHFYILFFASASYSARRDFIFVWCMWALLYSACMCVLALVKKRY